jgi:hypothetical protein
LILSFKTMRNNPVSKGKLRVGKKFLEVTEGGSIRINARFSHGGDVIERAD